MRHISNPIIKPKAGLLNFAEEFGYVSMGLKVVGVSRDMFYRIMNWSMMAESTI